MRRPRPRGRWPALTTLPAWVCPLQIPTPANHLREPLQGSERRLQPHRGSSPRGCPHLCRWPLAERDGDGDGEHSPGVTGGSACGRAPAGDGEHPFPRGGRANFSKHPPPQYGPNPLIAR